MEDGQNFARLSAADVYVWIAVIVMALFSGMFRVLRNGQWKGYRHATGVVGCSAIVSLFLATICHETFGFARQNPMLLIALSGAVALLGKETHERLISAGVDKLTNLRGSNEQTTE
jgi:hypothetical protein